MYVKRQFIDDVVEAMDFSLRKFIRLPAEKKSGCEGDRGGFFTLMPYSYATPVLTVMIGDIPTVSLISKFREYSLEKAHRLYSNKKHVSSWQSRNPKLHQYGGAIAVAGLILSFSGINDELWDEALMISGAKRLDWLRISELKDIVTASNNNFPCLLDRSLRI